MGAWAQTQEVRTFKVSDFSRLEVDIAADVELSQGDASLKIGTEKDFFDELKITQSGETLHIELRSNWSSRKSVPCKLYITMPQVKEISLSGSVRLAAKTALHGNDVRFDLSGSSKLDIPTLDMGTVEIDASGSTKAILGSSKVVNNLRFSVSGSGDFEASKMKAANVDIDISGSGKAVVNCSQKLDVDVSGSGKVLFYGSPRVESSISGSGKVMAANAENNPKNDEQKAD